MIAVLVLVIVIIATSKIFGTASRIAGVGMATTDVMQEMVAIDRQLREDVNRLSHEGFMAIRCWAVRNDVRAHLSGDMVGNLLDPLLPAGAWIRADQLVFFTHGLDAQQTFTENESNRTRALAGASRIYFGTAFQVPDTAPFRDAAAPVAPWYAGPVNLANSTNGASAGQAFIPPIPARQWILARQSILLADDDIQAPNAGGKLHYTDDGDQGENATYSIWDAAIRNSRRDMAASLLPNIRRSITRQYNVIPPGTWFPLPNARPWSSGPNSQRQVIAAAMFFPRAERHPPTTDRGDHALTIGAIGSGCSSVMIDWTYDHGAGEVRDGAGDLVYDGVAVPAWQEQPWFGMPDPLNPNNADPQRGVRTFAGWPWTDPANRTIYWENIEGASPVTALSGAPPGTIYYYEAFFGYNQDQPFDATGALSQDAEYTPWPSALRVTMRLHDPGGTLEAGREVQYILHLPRRGPS
jgi:hypothetical protein